MSLHGVLAFKSNFSSQDSENTHGYSEDWIPLIAVVADRRLARGVRVELSQCLLSMKRQEGQ